MRRGFVSALIALFLISTPAAAVEVLSSVDRFEKAVEQKILQSVKAVYGDTARIAASVQVVPKPPAQGTGTAQGRDELAYSLFGSDLVEDGSSGAAGVSTPEDFAVQSMKVSLQVAADLPPAIENSLKTFISSLLQPYAPQIEFTKVPIPQPALVEPARVDWKFLLALIAFLTATAVFALGMGSALKSSARDLASGIREAFPSKSPTPGKIALSGSLETRHPEGTDPASTLGRETSLHLLSPEKEFQRHFEQIQEMIREKPLVFLQTFKDQDEDWTGLRSLLPYMDSPTQDALRTALGERAKRIAEPADTTAGPQKFDATQWIRKFVQRAVAKQIGGGTELEKAIGPKFSALFGAAKPASLITAAKAVGTAAGWRIVAEYCPPDTVGQSLKSVDLPQLRLMMASGGALDPEETLRTANEFEAILLRESGGDAQGLQQLASYYRKNLLGLMLQRLSVASLEEEEQLLLEMQTTAPTLASLVHEKHWTWRMLERISDRQLTEYFTPLTVEQKALLIFVLPGGLPTRLEKLLREGNVKIITLDQVRRLKALGQVEVTRATEFLRGFLETLRMAAEAGKLEIEPDTATPIHAETPPPPKVAA